MPCIAKKLKVRQSKINRLGTFTEENIKKEEYILKTSASGGYKFLLYLNHSCRPNALLKKGRDRYSDTLFSVKNIKLGEEITIDYRKTRWAQEYFYNRIIKRYGGCRCPSCASKQKHKINLLKE